MQPVQTLDAGRRCRPACEEYGSGTRLGRLERSEAAAMEQAGIVKAGHDGHEGVEPRTVFRHPAATRRAECRQADVDRMREGRLRLAASTGRTESQAGPLAVARRAGVGKPVR